MEFGGSKRLGLAEGEVCFFLMSFYFLIKILRKTWVGRGEEGGPNLAKCPQTFSMPLRGLLKERWSHFLPPSKVPFPQCGSVLRKFGTFFLINGEVGGKS